MSGSSEPGRSGWVTPPTADARLSMPDADEALHASGERVWVAPVSRADLAPYREALAASSERIAPWNPVDPGDLEAHLRFQSTGHRTFVVHAREVAPGAGHDLVGVITVTGVVRGRAVSGTMGYNAYDPYSGTGLFAEGLRLVVDLVFAPEPRGMGLHRLEASVQPGNVRSAGLLRSLGFRRRAAWPGYLWLGDETGLHAWRDHATYGVVAEEWPAVPWSRAQRPRPVVVIGPAWGRAAADLAEEMGAQLIPARVVDALDEDGLTALLAGAPGAVLELPREIDAAQVERVTAVIAGAGYAPQRDLTIAGNTAPNTRGIVALALAALARGCEGGVGPG